MIVKFAGKVIPSYVEQTLHFIYKYFSKSPKRSAKWMSFQLELEIKELKMQKYIETRWLSEENCILRLLERWNELIDFLKTRIIKIVKKL